MRRRTPLPAPDPSCHHFCLFAPQNGSGTISLGRDKNAALYHSAPFKTASTPTETARIQGIGLASPAEHHPVARLAWSCIKCSGSRRSASAKVDGSVVINCEQRANYPRCRHARSWQRTGLRSMPRSPIPHLVEKSALAGHSAPWQADGPEPNAGQRRVHLKVAHLSGRTGVLEGIDDLRENES
jgi:hypothetical protein